MSPYYQKIRRATGSEMLLVPAVAAIIHDEAGRLLLQGKHDGSWSLPVGAIEIGESPEEAVTREVMEETGLRCERCDLVTMLGGKDYRHIYPNGDSVEYVIALYRCTVAAEVSEISDKEETQSIRYFSREEFPGLALPYSVDLLFRKE